MKKNIIRVLLVLCFLAGVVLMFNGQIKDLLVASSSEKYQLKQLDKEDIEKNEQAKASFDFSKVDSVSLSQAVKTRLTNENLPDIGGIAVPSVDINLPVFKGISNDALLSGAGTLKEDEQMGEGNFALAGHHMKDETLLFSPLEKVQLGDMIYLTDLTKVYAYTADYKEKVSPDRVDLIDDQPGKKMITLVTCGDAAATTRLIVQGHLTKVYPADDLPKKIAEAFDLPQKSVY